ncbi:MAG: hypothetical protein COA99_19375 [Moraxellaceae bacterium]|nr:MAG: hypothetical protein COA99_19375 [Moraxellaceae bacterium]
MDDRLPKEGESQEIGKLAGRAFGSKLPRAWTEVALDGDSDFGIDYLVQVKNPNGFMSVNFFLQLKGTTVPKVVDGGNAISFTFDSSTLNYYRKSEPALMVAIVDLSESERVSECTTYYKWLDDDFLDSISDKREKNDTVTIRISKSQIVDETLDVLPYYEARLKSRDDLTEFRRAVEGCSNTPGSDIVALAQAIKEKPIILEASKDESGAPWIVNPEEHIAGKLKLLFDAITNNQIEYAQALIDEIGGNPDLSIHENAEYLSLKGSLLTLLGGEDDAVDLYALAYDHCSESRYKVNYYESLFRQENIPKDDELESFVDNLSSDEFRECILKSKCLAILGRKDEALSALAVHPKKKIIIATLMVYIISGSNDLFDEFSAKVNLEELNPRSAFLYHIFIGRRLFYRGIGYVEGEDNIIPSRGKATYDFGDLKKSIDHIDEAMKRSRALGFPYDSNMLIDVASSLFSLFDREVEAITYIEEILATRPSSKQLIQALIPLKYNTRKYTEVIDLVSSLSHKSAEDISFLIAANYQAQRKSVALSLVEEYKEDLIAEKPQNYCSLFCMAAQCAYDTLNDEKEDEYLKIISVFDNGEELIAVYDYIKSCNDNPEKRGKYSEVLYSEYARLDRSFIIAQQLFPHLAVDSDRESLWLCELAETILFNRELYPEENISYAFSLSFQDRWTELEGLCTKVIGDSVPSNLWALLKASALDGQGRSAEALNVLDASLESDNRSMERAENYANLCVQLGFFEKAEEKMELIFEASAPKKQLSILESLMFIYSANSNNPEKLTNTIIRYGKLANKEDENQEGRYLLSFLTMTNSSGGNIDDYIRDFQDRLNIFVERFPDSKILRRGVVPLNSGEDALRELRRLASITDEQVEKWNKNRLLVRSGKLPVPYAMLPGFIDDIGDIFRAWIMGKYSGRDKAEYMLRHSSVNMTGDLKSIGTTYCQVVMDETALIVLNDLGVLEIALQNLPGVVINKSTYENFSRASHGVMGSIHSAIPKEIIGILGACLDKITLKGKVVDGISLIDQYQNIISECDSPLLCTDDLYLSEFVRHKVEGAGYINSITILEYLHVEGILSLEEKNAAIERLCSFGIISPSINLNNVVDSITYNLGIEGGVPLLDSGFSHIFNSVFTLDKEPKLACKHLCSFFSSVLNRCNSDIDIRGMGPMLSVWMVRYPSMGKYKLLATWFVMSCFDTVYVLESEFVPRGKGQASLLEIYKDLSINIDGDKTFLDISTDISKQILRLNADQASDVYIKVRHAFVEDSQEYLQFVDVYTNMSIEKRIRDAMQQ